MSDLEREAYNVLNNFGGGAVVFLWEGAIKAENALGPNGSGTVLRTPGGRLIVLTARHVFEDNPPDQYGLGGRAVRWGVADAIGAQHWHPTVDVAIALLKPHAAASFAEAALPVSMIAEPTDDATDNVHVMLCGFPAGYRRTAIDHQNKKVDYGFASVTYSTEVRGKDEKGRHRVRWADDAEMTGTLPMQAPDSEAARQLGIAPGQRFELTHPRGVSGGPLWRFTKVPKTEVWEPTKFARIIGVASTYLGPPDDVEFCPSVSIWGEWLHETVAKIDADASTANVS